MKKILIFLFILAVAVSFFIRKFLIISEKDRILKTLKIAEKSLEEKQHIKFMKQISLEYRDDFGNTWGTLFFYVKNILQNYSRIRISLSHMDIKIEGKRATVKFIGKGEAINPYGEKVREIGRFILKMKKEGTKWKIIYLEEEEYDFTQNSKPGLVSIWKLKTWKGEKGLLSNIVEEIKI